jgi:DNA polymerase-3 subunit alpha
MAGRFIHLHTHSHYSFLQALPKVEELVEKAKKEGMNAVALTDNANMHGAIEFFKEGQKEGVKPILGVDAYLAARSRFDRERTDRRSKIVLLAENNEGYENLLALITASFMEGLSDRPLMDREILRKHAAGVIAIIPSFAGDIQNALAANQDEAAGALLAEYESIFGKENVFLEISHHPKATGHEEKMKKLRAFAEKSGAKLLAQHDVYYLDPDDQEATSVMRRIQHGQADRNEDEDFSFVSEKDMRKWFKDIPEAVEIADRCWTSRANGPSPPCRFQNTTSRVRPPHLREVRRHPHHDARLGRRLPGRVPHRHHERESALLQAALRALPQP